MKNTHKKKFSLLEGKGFYIALCCCVVAIGITAYIGMNSYSPNEQVSDSLQVSEPSPTPVPTIAPSAATTPSSPAKTAKPTQKPAAKSTNAEAKQTEAPKQDTPSFTPPLLGKVIASFSGDKLIYNEILGDWRTHDGVDLKAEVGAEVKAVADGTVEEVVSNALGNCITIDHKNGYKTIYANLDDNNVTVGTEFKKGDVIAKVGETAICESNIESHLHFELIKDGKCIDPADVIQ
jgi:murein DD-endopeptidase MepM/ murein hydrolase activator NlpD